MEKELQSYVIVIRYFNIIISREKFTKHLTMHPNPHLNSINERAYQLRGEYYW